ncbi:SdpI family protein [Clostridium sardiniense]|uniref:SdpI family protein n=1 Tax=Clostridium sardiniense TaxID=29369 RepID=UPI00195A4FF1|nr:SdpI family protein [Clostridium sardiniense]MBM7833290.1 putative membrane protein [Clostridium sardiniense]
MGFWIFMMVSDLLIPLTMVGFGKLFMKNAPKEINGVYGYRTSMSMKNKDTWEFAHHYCGKLWLTIGGIMLVISAIAMLFVIGKDENVVGNFGGILCGIQLVFFIGSIFPTERALKKNFDERGNRKSEITKK